MGARHVMSPEGAQWQVRRRWLDRPLPDVRRRFREYREESVDEGAFDTVGSVDFGDSEWAGIVLAVVLVLLVIVLLPVIGVALELILLIALLGSGLIGRVVLRRPWTVEAVALDDGERSVAYAVKGWQRSGRAMNEIAATIETSGPPERISEGVRLP